MLPDNIKVSHSGDSPYIIPIPTRYIIDHCMDTYFGRYPSLWDTTGVWVDVIHHNVDLWIIEIDEEVQAVVVSRVVEEGDNSIFELCFVGARTLPRNDGQTIKIAQYLKPVLSFFIETARGSNLDIVRSSSRLGIGRLIEQMDEFRVVHKVYQARL